ncbi:MAG: class I SAM-dependent methyltransferase [bacterium]|nr:class I SAM-dependent methyltransferase [bacterium]
MDFPCDICGTTDAVEVPHAREYTGGQPIHICIQCGFVYVKQRRSAGAIADEWSEQIYGNGYTALLPAVRARLTFVAAFMAEQLGGLQGKRVCDIGAGEGVFLEMLRQSEYGAAVFGIEPSRANCARMTALGIPNFRGTIEEYAASGTSAGQYDIAVIAWTMENCQSPRAMLAAAHRMLRPGGQVVVATGSRIFVPFKKPLHYYLGGRAADSHAFRWSAQTLTAQLATAHFAVRQTNRYIDHDVLCMIAERRDVDETIPWTGDDYRAVQNFFERWHAETVAYYPEGVAVPAAPQTYV